MVLQRVCFASMAAMVAGGGTAWAAVFTYTGQYRSVSAFHPADSYGGGATAGTGPFSAQAGGNELFHDHVYALMHSDLAGDYMHIFGRASAGHGFGYSQFGQADSSGRVNFTTGEAMPLRIEGWIFKDLSEPLAEGWSDVFTDPMSPYYDPAFDPMTSEYLPSIEPFLSDITELDELSLEVQAPGGLVLTPSALPRTPTTGDHGFVFDFLYEGEVPAGSFTVVASARESSPYPEVVGGSFYVHIPGPGTAGTALVALAAGWRRRR